jgi:hypothetical protein
MALLVFASTASADTLLMPKRDYLMNVSEVVWGVTTQANGTPFVLDYGDGSPQTAGNVGDRSYIAFNHMYNVSGPMTVQLCVGAGAAIPACPGELATVNVNVYNGVSLSAFDLRGLNINRAIEDGLRYLWVNQVNRAANFPAGTTTTWQNDNSWGPPYTALVALAFQNHGYLLPNNNNAPTGIYERFVVQRALNYVASLLLTLNLTPQTAGDPCAGAITDPCVGLYHNFDPGYSNAVVALPFAASNALSRMSPVGIGNATYVQGQTYGSILQRIMNATAYGQNDGAAPNGGGWIYQFSNNSNQQTDGSTVGWDMLALLDAGAAGTTIPAFVKTEFQTKSLPGALNTDGSFDYRGDNNPAFANSPNLAKSAIGLQGLFYVGTAVSDAQVQAGLTYISDRWNSNALGQTFHCGNGLTNKGCGYGMFNAFKALKLYGVQTLPGVTRAAGPGPIPAGDWYADYVDYLVSTQSAPTSVAGGNWPSLDLSCCELVNQSLYAAIAELILAPVALIQPDPTLFATVGLTPFTADNPIHTEHTVTATATSANNQPVPGATVDFKVLTGHNAGKIGQAVTNAQGQASFTYTDTGPLTGGTDEIQASIGNLDSNIVEKNWIPLRCDTEPDGDVDAADLLTIRQANGQVAGGPNDPRDGNGDGRINVADVRYCSLRLTQ